MLIPVVQRNSESEVDNSLVDVVDSGQRAGVQVIETRDIYEAYKKFTGKDLPRLASTTDPRLASTAYDRLKAKADGALATYQQASGSIKALDPNIQDFLSSLVEQADSLAGRAADLERQGLQAGAFNYAWLAAAYSNAVARTGEAIQVLLLQGTDAFLAKIDSSTAIQGQVDSLLQSLVHAENGERRFRSDVRLRQRLRRPECVDLREQRHRCRRAGHPERRRHQRRGRQPPLPAALLGARRQHRRLRQGRVRSGPRSRRADINTADIDLTSIADFFRKGSDANFASFETTVVKDLGDSLGISQDQMLARFANIDIDVALAVNERNVLGGLTQYIGEGQPNAEYAQLGFAINNYARNALLVEKYYSNGQLDDNLDIVGVRSDAALSSGLDLAKNQLSGSITSLRGKDIEPALETALFESAGVDREGNVTDKFTALSSYWTGFVSARVLAYLGGFPTEGLE